MSSEQTTPEAAGAEVSPRGAQRGAILLISVAAALGGCALLLVPLLGSSEPWQWRLDNRDALVDATVNADLLSIDEAGIRLTQKGSRHLSLITPPLELPSGAGRILTIEASLPDVTATSTRRAQVKLLWQTEDVPEFKFESAIVELSAEPRSIEFSLPRPAPEIHRIGVQFPSLSGPVLIRSIGLPALSAGSRFGLALRELVGREPIGTHSINFLTGALILGHGLNYYLVSAVAACLGVYLSAMLLRRRRIRVGVMAGVVLSAWLVADAQFTWSMLRQSSDEAATFGGRGAAERVAIAYGEQLTWAAEQLKASSSEGQTFAVVSDDPFGPAHRLAYLLAPQRIRMDAYADAAFIVVIHGRSAVYDEKHRRFRVGADDWIGADVVSSFSPDVYLLRRRAP